ncbi:hydroxyacylglutathione hydrolase [Actibacterium mucosum KCTC 23349]|uniref:Hydroxyacylglutathione hydrolase n=1 Tax=Actibacterium mucosum KCTC 23349 TaxID=1454373 RepID=A0A037ZF61_9RHOB|nr:hydroxyacylglutathione hydrolase [Actibacterium mucosum]KAJ55120.1 hydroxyacylglutathione hydrolase [Actibacterium mucosum KCTC 23349]
MPLEIVTLPVLSDNYVFLLHNAETDQTATVDIPEAGPVRQALADRGWTLTDILITHHHDDHINGIPALKSETGARVVGASADAHRLPALDLAVADGDTIEVCGEPVHVMDVSGHTVGHVAYHFPQSSALFSGDSLMALGCGRLFEGSAETMWQSLSKLAALPPETIIGSGHEYTASNGKFALTIEPDNPDLISRVSAVSEARAAGKPTVPSLMSEELATNPFLRAHLPAIKASLGMRDASDAEVFGEIRKRKDRF